LQNLQQLPPLTVRRPQIFFEMLGKHRLIPLKQLRQFVQRQRRRLSVQPHLHASLQILGLIQDHFAAGFIFIRAHAIELFRFQFQKRRGQIASFGQSVNQGNYHSGGCW
jgi:hypothetical protein